MLCGNNYTTNILRNSMRPKSGASTSHYAHEMTLRRLNLGWTFH